MTKTISMSQQEAFSYLQKEISDLRGTILQVNANTIFAISLSKFILRALVDLDLADRDDIRAILQDFSQDSVLPEGTRELFEIYSKAFCADLNEDPAAPPKLRLVKTEAD